MFGVIINMTLLEWLFRQHLMALLFVALLFEVTLVVTVLAINFVENAVTLACYLATGSMTKPRMECLWRMRKTDEWLVCIAMITLVEKISQQNVTMMRSKKAVCESLGVADVRCDADYYYGQIRWNCRSKEEKYKWCGIYVRRYAKPVQLNSSYNINDLHSSILTNHAYAYAYSNYHAG